MLPLLPWVSCGSLLMSNADNVLFPCKDDYVGLEGWMTQSLIVHTALAEEPSLVPSTHTKANNSLLTPILGGSCALLWPLRAPVTPVVHRHMVNIHTHKIKTSKSSNLSFKTHSPMIDHSPQCGTVSWGPHTGSRASHSSGHSHSQALVAGKTHSQKPNSPRWLRIHHQKPELANAFRAPTPRMPDSMDSSKHYKYCFFQYTPIYDKV